MKHFEGSFCGRSCKFYKTILKHKLKALKQQMAKSKQKPHHTGLELNTDKDLTVPLEEINQEEMLFLTQSLAEN